MPNHVTNQITISGDQDKVLELLKKVSKVEGDQLYPFDFEKIIPSPDGIQDITEGTLTYDAFNIVVSMLAASLTEKAKEFHPISRNSKIMELSKEIIGDAIKNETPPKELFKGLDVLSIQVENPEKLLDAPKDVWMDAYRYAFNKLEYGAGGWYAWNCAHWGTKWNCYSMEPLCEVVEDKLPSDDVYTPEIQFQTAWSHPTPVIFALAKMFPDVRLSVRYADEDFGFNVGEYVLEGETVISENVPEGGTQEAYNLALDIMPEYLEYIKTDIDGLPEYDENGHLIWLED